MRNSVLLAIVAFVSLCSCEVVFYNFEVSWMPAAPDGFRRDVIAINGLFPGPTIEIYEGDTVVINVTNLIPEELSIHWHGLFQRGSVEHDGGAFVTECPIPQGTWKIYRFTVRQHGTYWYHSHAYNQYIDGCKGAFIVHKAEEAYDCADEVVVQVTDWYHEIAESLFVNQYYTPQSGGNEPIPETILINGIGGNIAQIFSVPNDGPTRFRIINTAAFAVFRFSIDEHVMFITEADGVDVRHEDVTVDAVNQGSANSPVTHLRLNVGQRYSVLVFPKPGFDTRSYWMRVEMEDSVFPGPSTFNTSKAILNYGPFPAYPISANTELAMMSSFPCPNCLDVSSLVPIVPNRVLEPTRYTQFDIDFFVDPAINVEVSHLNNITCLLPIDTTYLSLLRAGVDLPLDPCLLETVDYNDVVRVVINNHDDGEHPIHLHGHVFQILSAGFPDDGNYDPNVHTLQLNNPLRRDTITVNPLSYIVLQFTANNPGFWMMHCHIDWHMMIGLGMVWNVAPEMVVQRMGTIQAPEKCPINMIYTINQQREMLASQGL